MTSPYYADRDVTLYHGDCREVLPALDLTVDAIVADPPYGETSLVWDRWPDGWPAIAATAARSMWCFGSMRMFLDHRDEFGGWKLSQDIIWRKGVGTSFQADRFAREHEHAVHWYRGEWRVVHHDAQRTSVGVQRRGLQKQGRDGSDHLGRNYSGTWTDDGTRLTTSVIASPNLRGRAIHPTEKPVGVLAPLIRYACPPGGTVHHSYAVPEPIRMKRLTRTSTMVGGRALQERHRGEERRAWARPHT